MKSPEEVKSEFVREWLSKANADLLASRHLLKEESKLAFVSAFHAQQAVEKALKALLVWHQIEFPKTHDIRRLLDLLTSPEPELSKELDEASSLTDYAIEHRYPADIPEPTVSQAKEAIELAERVVNEVLSRLPSKFSATVEESESWSPGTE